MKITGILACFLLLTAGSVRADSFSFRDNYFKNPTIGLSGLSLKDWAGNKARNFSFHQGNEGPVDLLAKNGLTLSRPRVKDPTARITFTPVRPPDPKTDYKTPLRQPRSGFDYKLRLLPTDVAEAAR